MPHLLRLDASARTTGSHSRALGDVFESRWRDAGPNRRVIRRDLADEPIPTIDQQTIAAFFTPADRHGPAETAAAALSDRLIHELQSADELLITAPIYNFSVPAALKCWIDQVVRINRTFAYEDGAFRGLVNADRATLIAAYGAPGYLHGGPFQAADFLKPYLEFLLGFLGVHELRFVGLEGSNADGEALAAARLEAERAIDRALAA